MSWSLSLQATLGHAVLDVHLTGRPGTTVLTGPNGAGKTTLLRCYAGTLRRGRGRVVLGDQILQDDAAGVRLAPEARGVGYLPQGFALFPHLSVLDNVAFGLQLRGVDRSTRRATAQRLLTEFGCSALATRRPRALSGGERQRVALARSLAISPRLLLLDEPLAAIDAGARRTLRGVLAARLASLGVPALVATHDVRDALALDAHVVVLEEGKVCQEGPVAELRAAPRSDFVAEFTGV